MQIERFSTDIKLKHKPTNATQAYTLMVQSLQNEIEEKQSILSELRTPNVKERFIADWNPNITNVLVCNL